jgi:hypothetical protein
MASPSTPTIFVNKFFSGDADALAAVMSQFGTVVDTFIKPPRGGRKRHSFAFVTFADPASAQSVVDASPLTVGQDTVLVELRTSKPYVEGEPREPRAAAEASCHIYINQLNNQGGDDSSLRSALECFGELTDLKLRFKEGEGRGFAFASFAEQAMAEAAVAASPIAVGPDVCEIEMSHTKPRPAREKKEPSSGEATKKKRKKKRRKRPPLEQQLYIKGLEADTAEEDIVAALSGFGEVKDVYRRKQRGQDSDEEGKTLYTDYAFVTFAEIDAVEAAAAAGVVVNGNLVTAEPRRPREAAAEEYNDEE